VYCAPTSGGKSLIADILVLQNVHSTSRPALLVLPLITLCEEKCAYLQTLFAAPLNWKVIEMFGSDCSVTAEAAVAEGPGIIVCTIEKANSFINRLWSVRNSVHLGDVISTVVVDELHMLGDPERGYQIEILLSKLKYGNTADKYVNIIAMSATLPNGKDIALWLDAVYYDTSFRPLSLKRFLVHPSGEVFDNQGNRVRTVCNGWRGLSTPANVSSNSRGATTTSYSVDERCILMDLVAESFVPIGAPGHPTLIFCASRAACVKTAITITKVLGPLLPHDSKLDRLAEKLSRMYQLSDDNDDNDENCRGVIDKPVAVGSNSMSNISSRKALLASIRKGVAFHHAGLEREERRLIEDAFKKGSLMILCATSTLAAGVNLPARRVIIRHPFIGGPPRHLPLDAATYLQMAGRAGRAGILHSDLHESVVGEAYLMAAPRVVPLKETEKIVNNPEPEPIRSCLGEGISGMARALLEGIATGAVSKPFHVKAFVDSTLLAFECKNEKLRDSHEYVAADVVAKSALKWLAGTDVRLIKWNATAAEGGAYEPTPWGRAVLAAGLPPESCLEMRSDLLAMSQVFYPSTELHLAYLCVPGTSATDGELVRVTDSALGCGTDHWRRVLKVIEGLKGPEAAVAQGVGVDMAFLVASARGLVSKANAKVKVEVKVKGWPPDICIARGSRGSLDCRERVCRRLWGGLIICDVLREVSTVLYIVFYIYI
jgi:DNA polymerase theta